MPCRTVAFSVLILAVCCLSRELWLESKGADDKDQTLFNLADEATVKDWVPVKLSDVEKEQPAAKVEIVPLPKAKGDAGLAGNCLKITFDAGDWPTVGKTKLPAVLLTELVRVASDSTNKPRHRKRILQAIQRIGPGKDPRFHHEIYLLLGDENSSVRQATKCVLDMIPAD